MSGRTPKETSVQSEDAELSTSPEALLCCRVLLIKP